MAGEEEADSKRCHNTEDSFEFGAGFTDLRKTLAFIPYEQAIQTQTQFYGQIITKD